MKNIVQDIIDRSINQVIENTGLSKEDILSQIKQGKEFEIKKDSCGNYSSLRCKDNGEVDVVYYMNPLSMSVIQQALN